MAMQITLLILMLAAPAVYGAQHIVGGTGGWSQTAGSYATWAAGQTFLVGDTLLFNYDSSHKVDVVSQADYISCSSANSISSYSGGSTTIALPNVGQMYFICPTAGHCVGGMKLAVNVTAAPAVYGTQHIVGGTGGWSQTAGSYVTWAASETFLVGDTLLFNYDSSHKVDVVSQADYISCSSANSISSYSSGSTTIVLPNVGQMYFICPTAGHCVGGMKLAVNVTAASGTPPTTTPTTPPPPSTTPTPPTPPGTPSTTPPPPSTTPTPPTPPGTPSTTTPSTTVSPPPPPPPHSGAASIYSSMNNLMFGFTVVIGTMFAFMG